MNIMRGGERPTKLARGDWFTGRVWQDPIIEAPEPARIRALRVAFEPGARTNWHAHPLGQTLYVTDGAGYVALRGEAPQPIGAGDTVWIPPHVEHWHGAGPETSMVHIAMQEELDGSVADWLEAVNEADYPQA
ncbi:MAG: cupin domain-containing protein [Pseudomonadota bacterium]